MSDYPPLPESGPEAPRLHPSQEIAEPGSNQSQQQKSSATERDAEPRQVVVDPPAPPSTAPVPGQGTPPAKKRWRLTSRQRRAVAAKRRHQRRQYVVAVIVALAVVAAVVVVLLMGGSDPVADDGAGGRSAPLAFGVEALISVDEPATTVWGVTVGEPKPVSVEADSHLRFDVVVRLVSSSSSVEVAMPESPFVDRWRLSWGGLPYPPGSWGPDGCVDDVGYMAMPAEIELEVGGHVSGSLCLWPPLIGERWQVDPFVHLSLPARDVVFTTDGLRADQIELGYSDP